MIFLKVTARMQISDIVVQRADAGLPGPIKMKTGKMKKIVAAFPVLANCFFFLVKGRHRTI